MVQEVSSSAGRLAAAVALSAWLASCSAPADRSNPQAAVSVQVAPPSAQLTPLATQPFTAVVTGAGPGVVWSVLEGAGSGTVATSGLYTAPAAVGTFHVVATSTSDPGASGSAVVTVAVAGASQQAWVGATSGMVTPHFDNGYAGAFDQSPLGRSDSLVVTGWDQGSPTELRVAYGLLGQTAPLPVARFPNAAGNAIDYGGSCQDDVTHDIHVVYGTFGGYVQYWRLRPQRTGAGGAVTGLTQIAQFSLPGARYIDFPAIQEVVDASGARRLAVYGAKTVVAGRADMALLVTTAAAGTAPASAADFTGPGGEAAAVVLATLPITPYDTMTALAQHRTTRSIEMFMASGQHGATGPQVQVTLSPAGAGWAAGAPQALPIGAGSAFAVSGPGDDVWLEWSDASAVHVSRFDAAGAMTAEGVPTPMSSPEDYRGTRHLAFAPDGRMMALWYLDSIFPARVRSNVFGGAAWSGWVDANPGPGTIYNYAPIQGLAQSGGRTWSASALSVAGTETTVTAVSF